MPPGLQTFLFFQQGGAEATHTSMGKVKKTSRVVFVRGGETARNDVGKGRRQHPCLYLQLLPFGAVQPPIRLSTQLGLSQWLRDSRQHRAACESSQTHGPLGNEASESWTEPSDTSEWKDPILNGTERSWAALGGDFALWKLAFHEGFGRKAYAFQNAPGEALELGCGAGQDSRPQIAWES